MQNYKLIISGMHCMNSCVRAVREELTTISNLEIVDIRVNEATVRAESGMDSRLQEAIAEAGFKLEAIQPE